MLSQREKTPDVYIRIGALMRLCKELFAKLIVASNKVLTVSDSSQLNKARDILISMSNKLENDMYENNIDLTEDYKNVFWGSIDYGRPRSKVDQAVLQEAFDISQELFGLKN